MEYVYHHDKKRFVQFAVRVWDVDLAYGEEDEICLEGIRRMREFFKKLNMPLTFEDAGLPTTAFEEMAEKATYGDTIPVGNFVKCIFRKNCASVPEERSAIPLQTEQSSAG